MKKITYTILIVTALISLSISANSGKDIFDRYCTVCHSPSMATMFNSPAAHDINAWNERKENILKNNPAVQSLSSEERNKEAIKGLILSATNGTENGMPPMGTCMDCTSSDLEAAIKFMSTTE